MFILIGAFGNAALRIADKLKKKKFDLINTVFIITKFSQECKSSF